MNAAWAHLKYGALTSVAASAISALALFVVFRLTIELQSTSLIGCWALLQGLFMVARIADTGAGNNVTRVVSVRRSSGIPVSQIRITAASLILTALPVAFLCALIYLPITIFVKNRYSNEISTSDIVVLSTCCVLFAVLSSAGTILLAVLEGAGKLSLKNGSLIFSNVAGILVAYPFLDRYDALGLGLVYITIAVAQCACACASLWVIRGPRSDADDSVRSIVAEMWRENAQLSLISLMRLSFEPATKLMLSFVGTLAAVAAFELALRVSTQARILVQSALQPLLVAGSWRENDHARRVDNLFATTNSLVKRISVRMVEVEILAAPAICFLGLGYFDGDFLVFFVILALGSGLNSCGQVGYFYQLSSGVMGPIIRIHVIMAFVNIILGILSAWLVGAIGVVGAYGLAFAIGGLGCLALLPPAAGGARRLHQQFGVRTGLGDVVRLLVSGVLAVLAFIAAGHTPPWMVVCACLALSLLIATHSGLSIRKTDRLVTRG